MKVFNKTDYLSMVKDMTLVATDHQHIFCYAKKEDNHYEGLLFTTYCRGFRFRFQFSRWDKMVFARDIRLMVAKLCKEYGTYMNSYFSELV